MEAACCRRRPVCQLEVGSASSSSSEARAGESGVCRPAAKRPREAPQDDPIELTPPSPASGSGQKQNQRYKEGVSLNSSPRFDGLNRKELVRLLLQTLGDLGLQRTQTILQEESGVALESSLLSSFREAVLKGCWAKALQDLQLMDTSPESLKAIRFHLLERRLLEALSHSIITQDGNDTEDFFMGEAAEFRQDFLDASFDAASRERVHRVGEYLSCRTLEALEQASGWSLREDSREVLWERVALLLPAHVVIPPRRLSVLLWQAVRYQQLHCVYRDVDQDSGDISLLQDYTYKLPPLPTRCIAQIDHHSDEVWFATSSYNGRYIASSSKDPTVLIWHFSPPATFSVARTLSGHTEPCLCIAWSLDDEYVVTASSDRTIRLWSLLEDNAIRVFAKHREPVTSVAWLHDSRHFVSAGFDRCIYLWHVDGSEVHRWEVQSRVQDIGISYDGTRMVVVNSDRNLKVFDVSSRRELFSLPENDAVTSVHMSQLREDVLVNIAQQVSSSQHAPVIRLWDIAARRVTQRYIGHFQSRFVVRSCFGGPREEFVVSGSEDAQVYIWHRHYGSLLEVLAGHSASVTSVCWLNSPSFGCSATSWLVSASDDHTLRVWSSSMSIEEHRVDVGIARAEEAEEALDALAEPEVEAAVEPLGVQDAIESPDAMQQQAPHSNRHSLVHHEPETEQVEEETMR